MNNTPVLEARGLRKCYVANRPALDINLILPHGKVIGLLGPNGSGKTTLIKLAAGLLRPTAGELLISGGPVSRESKAIVSYLPERNAIPNWMTVADALDFYTTMFDDLDRERAIYMLDTLQIPAGQKIRTLSKGMKEKVQVVLAMSRHAELFLLDEPIGGVDPATRDFILDAVIRNREPNSTVLISTHLIADVEPILDEFVFLRGGRVMRYGPAQATREEEGKTLDQLFREVFRC